MSDPSQPPWTPPPFIPLTGVRRETVDAERFRIRQEAALARGEAVGEDLLPGCGVDPETGAYTPPTQVEFEALELHALALEAVLVQAVYDRKQMAKTLTAAQAAGSALKVQAQTLGLGAAAAQRRIADLEARVAVLIREALPG